jgi:hypothetical protein
MCREEEKRVKVETNRRNVKARLVNKTATAGSAPANAHIGSESD